MPGPTNADRADGARSALELFMRATVLRADDREDPQTQREQAGDLIANLLHSFCKTEKEAQALLDTAFSHFAEELEEEKGTA